MLSNTINQKIAEALKAKDVIKLSTLRLLSSAFNYERIAKQHDLSEEEEVAVIRREAKRRQDAIESIRLAQGKSTSSDQITLERRLAQEGKELEILKEFLPQELSSEEMTKFVEEAISETGATNIQEMGKVMAAAMSKVGGRADGRKISEIVKNKLSP